MKLVQRLALGLWLFGAASTLVSLDVAFTPTHVHAQAAEDDNVKPLQEGDPGDGKEDAAESRSATFQAVQGGKGEDVPGGPLLIAAYGTILVLLVLYVARLGALHAKNRSELDRLARVLERGGPKG